MQTPAQSLLPIRTVSQLTGVNAVTLRAWERRYGLVIPQRTPKGHRLYTQHDVELIHRIVDLLERGISVSHVKPLLESYTTTQEDNAAQGSDLWGNYQHDLLNAIESFNENAIDQIYNDAMSLYPIDVVNQRLITPLLEKLGTRWEDREAGIAEEHFFSVYLRNKIGARIHHLNPRSHGQQLVVACLTGEQHDLGLLFFALAAVNSGYRLIILGADLPLTQIPPVLKRQTCIGVVLSGASLPDQKILHQALPELVEALDVPVFLGGKISENPSPDLEASGAILLGSNIISGLRLINQTLISK